MATLMMTLMLVKQYTGNPFRAMKVKMFQQQQHSVQSPWYHSTKVNMETYQNNHIKTSENSGKKDKHYTNNTNNNI